MQCFGKKTQHQKKDFYNSFLENMTHVLPLLVKRRICMELYESIIPVRKL